MGQQETPRNPPPIVRVPSYFSCYSIYIIQHNSIPDSALSPGSSLWRGQRPETPFSFPELRSFWPAPQIDAVGTSCMGTHCIRTYYIKAMEPHLNTRRSWENSRQLRQRRKPETQPHYCLEFSQRKKGLYSASCSVSIDH